MMESGVCADWVSWLWDYFEGVMVGLLTIVWSTGVRCDTAGVL